VNLQLELASREKISEIQRLADEIWHDHYVEIIGQSQVDYMLGRFYSTASMESQMEAGQRFYCVTDGDNAMGFVAIEKKEDGCFFLNKLYVKTLNQRGGLGAGILNELTSEMPGLRELRLQVNRQNYKAINFYFKMGFVIECVADFDIGDGYFMNDFVMLKKY
jgi:GNAT superfamily N-acetyltransferase